MIPVVTLCTSRRHSGMVSWAARTSCLVSLTLALRNLTRRVDRALHDSSKLLQGLAAIRQCTSPLGR